jgi:hypothetical protein
MENYRYFVPDYLKSFSCKMGACRHACCNGWQVSISMENYFKLLGLDCSPDMRRRLDVGLRLLDRRSPEEYAFFNPRYDGDCPMRMADGRCQLHAEIGEEVLSDVCRLYPRGVRNEEEGLECSLANSCEGVLELFLHKEEKMTFGEESFSFAPPPFPGKSLQIGLEGKKRALRLYFISILQKRDLPLAHRLLLLGGQLKKVALAVKEKDGAAIDRLLSSPLPCVESFEKAEKEDLEWGLAIMERLVDGLDRHSVSIREAGQEALSYFESGASFESYEKAKRSFEEHLPSRELFFEHVLVNHLFFSLFPFKDAPDAFEEEYVALCTIYALMRFLCLGCLAREYSEEKLIDLLAAAFRLIDHTDFERYASKILKSSGCEKDEAHRLLLL